MTDQLDTIAIRAQMEALTGFTAGPWRDEDGVIQSQTTVWQNGVKQVGWDYATIRAEVTDDWDQAANARLIAAAPELLEALEAMIEWDDREKDHAVDFYKRTELCEIAFQKARAAIAKATGE